MFTGRGCRPRQPCVSMLVCMNAHAHSVASATMGSTSLLTRQVHRGTRAGQRNGALSSVFVKTPDPRDFFGRPKAVSPVNESTSRNTPVTPSQLYCKE